MIRFSKNSVFEQLSRTNCIRKPRFDCTNQHMPCVATDDAPSCEVPSRRRTIKPPAWQKDYLLF